MTAQIRESPNTSLPSPFPEGWYFVASRKAVQKARLLQKTWMGRRSSFGATTTDASVLPRPTVHTWAPTWDLLREDAYATAGSSVPSMASSTMQPASASPLPTLPRRGLRGWESSRRRRSPD